MKEFRLTGRHVLFTLIGFFLVIITVNSIFISFAVRTFPGEHEKKSYMQGVAYNDRLAARDVQEALGWSADIIEVKTEADKTIIAIAYRSKDGRPLSGLNVQGRIARTVAQDADRDLRLAASGAGVYRAELPALAPGLWRLSARAVSPQAETFTFNTDLVLE